MSTTPVDRTEPTAREILSTHRSADVQRRRREVALTATWLRELRGLTGAGTTVTTGRFKRTG